MSITLQIPSTELVGDLKGSVERPQMLLPQALHVLANSRRYEKSELNTAFLSVRVASAQELDYVHDQFHRNKYILLKRHFAMDEIRWLHQANLCDLLALLARDLANVKRVNEIMLPDAKRSRC